MGTGGREEAFETAFRANPLPLTITRASDGLIFDANPAWLARLGFTRDEVVGRRMSDIGFSAYPTLEPELVETPSMSTRDRIVSARAVSGRS